MRVRDIMTEGPACCTRNTRLLDVAKMMVDHNCGAIPVVESREHPAPVGIVTDRDIVCRLVAQDKDPRYLTAEECMTPSVVTVDKETELEDCERRMSDYQVRRILVTDAAGNCCGIVAQADIAINAPEEETGQVVQGVSS